MKIGGIASYVADATSREELQQLYKNAKKIQQSAYIIGGGSNLIAHDEGFGGVIIRNMIKGIEVVADDEDSTTIRAASGEIWDDLVALSVDRNLLGIEAMSGIPGTVGAAPVQNIGAYGQELADTFVSLEAYDIERDQFVELTWEDCGFSYRNSIFRSSAAGQYAIVSVTLKLFKRTPQPPFYSSLQSYLDENNAKDSYTVQDIRDAVITIRLTKLPDPKLLPNSGSFFKNAIIESWQRDNLLEKYGDIPSFKVDESHFKIPAGWLIENVDLKGEVLHGIKVHSDNAVVLINDSATGYGDLVAARDQIISAVRDKFQIVLEQEPVELYPPKK